MFLKLNVCIIFLDHEYQRKRKMYDVFFSLRNIDKAYLLVEQYTQQLLKRLETKEGVPFDIFRDILVMTGKTMMGELDISIAVPKKSCHQPSQEQTGTM